MAVHVHLSLLHLLITGIEVLLVFIPMKIVSANYVNRSPIAQALFGVV